jgi:hypothetical protein
MPTINDDQFEHGRIPLKPLPYSSRELASTNEFIIDYDGDNATYHMYISDSNDPSVLIDLTQKIIEVILPDAKINADQFQITIEGVEDPTSLRDIINFIYKRFTYANNPNGFVYDRDIDKVMDPTTKTILLQNTDGTILLPVTTADAVVDETGTTIQQRLDNMTRLGFAVDYLKATQQNQVQFTITYPFKNYSDFVEIRIGTVIVDKTRYAIVPDYDNNGDYTTATLTFIDAGYGAERIEIGRRVDVLFIYNALATSGGPYEYMYGGNIADGSIPISKLQKISDSYTLNDPTSVATSKAVRGLYNAVFDTLSSNDGAIIWGNDSSNSTSSIVVEASRYPATMFNDANLPRVMYILLKSNKLANCTLDVGGTSWSQTFTNLYNPNLTVNTTNFIAGTLLKIMFIKDGGAVKPVLLESGITNNRSRFIHLCIDQETTISYAGLSYTASDIINVYRNGVRLFQDVDYSINAAAQTITLYVRTEDGERIIFETSKG